MRLPLDKEKEKEQNNENRLMVTVCYTRDETSGIKSYSDPKTNLSEVLLYISMQMIKDWFVYFALKTLVGRSIKVDGRNGMVRLLNRADLYLLRRIGP